MSFTAPGKSFFVTREHGKETVQDKCGYDTTQETFMKFLKTTKVLRRTNSTKYNPGQHPDQVNGRPLNEI